MNLCGLMGKAPLKQFKAKNKYNSDASQLISLTRQRGHYFGVNLCRSASKNVIVTAAKLAIPPHSNG